MGFSGRKGIKREPAVVDKSVLTHGLLTQLEFGGKRQEVLSSQDLYVRFLSSVRGAFQASILLLGKTSRLPRCDPCSLVLPGSEE